MMSRSPRPASLLAARLRRVLTGPLLFDDIAVEVLRLEALYGRRAMAAGLREAWHSLQVSAEAHNAPAGGAA